MTTPTHKKVHIPNTSKKHLKKSLNDEIISSPEKRFKYKYNVDGE